MPKSRWGRGATGGGGMGPYTYPRPWGVFAVCPKEQSMVVGFCVDCNLTVELNLQGGCMTCGSGSTMLRGANPAGIDRAAAVWYTVVDGAPTDSASLPGPVSSPISGAEVPDGRRGSESPEADTSGKTLKAAKNKRRPPRNRVPD